MQTGSVLVYSETPLQPLEAEREWYALRVKPQHERTVGYALHRKGFERYVPMYRSRRRWSDRFKEIELPLFQGYVFCRMSREERSVVLSTPGIYHIVGIGNEPEPIAERELQVIRRVQAAGAPIAPWPMLRAGQRVQIERGPLAGLEGVLAASTDAFHVVVNVELLQRAVAVTVDREQLAPVRPELAAAALA